MTLSSTCSIVKFIDPAAFPHGVVAEATCLPKVNNTNIIAVDKTKELRKLSVLRKIMVILVWFDLVWFVFERKKKK